MRLIRIGMILLLALSLLAQGPRGNYTYQKSTSLSSAAETVTIHLPSSAGSRTVKFVGISIYCSVACTATLARDGTAPTTTAGTVVKLNSTDATASAVPYHTSNVGAGTTIKTYTVPAASEIPIEFDLKGLKLGENVTLSTNSISGDVRIFFQWQEF